MSGTGTIRQNIQNKILAHVGTQESFDEYRFPRGEIGLFGPQSMPWVVHRDLPAMLIGGFSALMLQTLQPLAMAGIAQHSLFRTDPLGRLHRTARYVAGTTFGPNALADQLIAQVRSVHEHVVGVAPDGRAYAANDPALLTWVHTTEVWGFLHSYLRYGPQRIDSHQQDRYFAEVAVLAYRLGAVKVPESTREVAEYFAMMRPSLSVSDDAREAVAFLRTPVSQRRSEQLAHRIVTAAAIDLLPRFARHELHLHRVALAGPVTVRTSARALGAVMRWAVGPSRIAATAEERVGQRNP